MAGAWINLAGSRANESCRESRVQRIPDVSSQDWGPVVSVGQRLKAPSLYVELSPVVVASPLLQRACAMSYIPPGVELALGRCDLAEIHCRKAGSAWKVIPDMRLRSS